MMLLMQLLVHFLLGRVCVCVKRMVADSDLWYFINILMKQFPVTTLFFPNE